MWFIAVKKKIDENNGDEDKDGPPAKVVWNLPIIPRFKWLFSIKEDAKKHEMAHWWKKVW